MRALRLDSRSFVKQLESDIKGILSKVGSEKLPETPDLISLLKIALKNEIEVAEIAAKWMASTREVDAKVALAIQAGDEAKHYNLIAERLEDLGADLKDYDPFAKGYSPYYLHLATLDGTIERISAGQFTTEMIATALNDHFMKLCQSQGDRKTAKLYRDIIQKDEKKHYEMGKALLEKYCTTPEAQQKARDSAMKILEVGGQILGKAKELGITHPPGC